MKHTNDPLEKLVSQTLDELGIKYSCPDADSKFLGPGSGLDFHLTELNIFIECKAWGTARIHPQVENVNNCVVLIGMKATKMFCDMLKGCFHSI